MRVHYLQHVPFEGPAAVEDWAGSRGHSLSGTEFFRRPSGDGSAASTARREDLPDPDGLDFLVVMGGPMGVQDTDQHPWLEAEKAFIHATIVGGKAVLGICLGAQLVAGVLGGTVAKGAHPEIGWYPVELTEAGRADPVFAPFPDTFVALHWHGDTFAIPTGAVHVASSEACPDQAFSLDDGRVVGLQFHLEETPASLAMLVEHASGDLDRAETEPWVAPPEELLSPAAPYEACRELLFGLLDRMAARVGA